MATNPTQRLDTPQTSTGFTQLLGSLGPGATAAYNNWLANEKMGGNPDVTAAFQRDFPLVAAEVFRRVQNGSAGLPISKVTTAWPTPAEKYAEAKAAVAKAESVPDGGSFTQARNADVIAAGKEAAKTVSGFETAIKNLILTDPTNPLVQQELAKYNAGDTSLNPMFADYFAKQNNYFKQGQAAPGQLTTDLMQQAEKQWAVDAAPAGWEADMYNLTDKAGIIAPGIILGTMTGGLATPALGSTGGAMLGAGVGGATSTGIATGGDFNAMLKAALLGAVTGGAVDYAKTGTFDFGGTPAATTAAPVALPPGGLTNTGVVPPLNGPIPPTTFPVNAPISVAPTISTVPGIIESVIGKIPSTGNAAIDALLAGKLTELAGGNPAPTTGNGTTTGNGGTNTGTGNGGGNGGGTGGGGTTGGGGGGLMSGNFDWLGQLMSNTNAPIAINTRKDTSTAESGGDVSGLRTLLAAMQPLSTAQGMDANIRQIYQQGFEAQMPTLYNASAGAGFDPVASSVQQLKVNDLNARLAGTAAQALTQQQTATGAVAEALAKNSGSTAVASELTDYQIDPMAALLMSLGSLGSPLSTPSGSGSGQTDPLASIRNLFGI